MSPIRVCSGIPGLRTSKASRLLSSPSTSTFAARDLSQGVKGGILSNTSSSGGTDSGSSTCSSESRSSSSTFKVKYIMNNLSLTRFSSIEASASLYLWLILSLNVLISKSRRCSSMNSLDICFRFLVQTELSQACEASNDCVFRSWS